MARDTITVICGTNRPQAASRAISNHVCEVLKKQTQKVACIDLADLKSDLFNATSYAEKPEWFLKEFQEPINSASKIIFVVPEYNGSFPGVLKYFIDMLSFPQSLKGVPVAFIGVAAGSFGALRAVEQVEMICHYLGAYLFPERLFIPQVTSLVSPKLELGDKEERLKSLLERFQAVTVS
jgi:chromate reductase, NAD(P)H dehydrogenase (quinone)